MTMAPDQRLRDGFAGAVVLVVGGFGDVGTQVTLQCLELGADVIAASRSPRTLGDGAHPHLYATQVDVNDLVSVRALMADIAQRFGRIDVLVNTAGSTVSVAPERLDLLTDDVLDEVFRANAVAPLRLIREAEALLRQGTEPVIVNVSSVAARTGRGSNIAYGAAKAALDAAVVALAKSMGPAIRLVNVAPSALDNQFVPDRSPIFLERTVAQTPLGRLARADEVATAIVTAARLLTATTGVTIAVDGGRHL